MDVLQPTFKESYIRVLKDSIEPEKYYEIEFQYDPTMVRKVAGIYQPKGLCAKMIGATDKCDSAILLYEAYKDLPLVVASNEAFWVYLTHVDLFDYVKMRWSDVLKKQATSSYIKDHWFYDGSPMRTSIMEYWWGIYCTVDESRGEENKYDLSRVLFENETFRTRVFGTSLVIRHREAMLGILGYIYDHPAVKSSYEDNGRKIASHFNLLGATKQLAYLDHQFFYDEMGRLFSNKS